MSLLSRLLEGRSYSLENPGSPLDGRSLAAALSGPPSASGRSVSPSSALTMIAVYACVRLVAQTVASLPLPIYQRLSPRGRERAPWHPLYSLLHDAPNTEMTAYSFREALQGHLMLWGNAYAEIVREGERISALWPLRPDRMRVERVPGAGLLYSYSLLSGETLNFQQQSILHLRGFGADGRSGYSPIQLAREAIGIGLAAEEFGARFFARDARPGGILTHPGKLDADAVARLKASWESAHSGLSNAHRVAVLEEGITWQALGMPLRDAQFLETRKHQTTEIARLFNVPPHMIQDLERATFTNIEHQSIDFVVHSLRPWLVNWEQELKRSLLAPAERGTYYAEHLVDALLRGDSHTRAQSLQIQRQNGVINADEWREIENLNPIPDGQGQIYIAPLNMTPLDKLGENKLGRPSSAPPEEPATDSARAVRAQERRSGSAAARLKLSSNYRHVMRDAARRLVKRETGDVREAARRVLGRRDAAQMERWLDDYYDDARAELNSSLLLPALTSYAEAIYEDASAEIGRSADGLSPEMVAFVAAYAASFGRAHVQRSRGQLQQVIRRAVEDGRDPLDALLDRLGEWDETRADKITEIQLTRTSGAVTRETWKRGNIRRIRWVAQGAKTCPFCQNLDGKTVGIEQVFLSQGEDYEPEGASSALSPSSDVTHPPVHATCVCGIAPD